MYNFFIWLKVCCIPPNVGGSEKVVCGFALVALKRSGCDVWQMECQASNVTANVQSDHLLHGYMVTVFITTDQVHRPSCCAEIQPMSQQDASTTRPYRGLVLDACEKWKRWKICHSDLCNSFLYLGHVKNHCDAITSRDEIFKFRFYLFYFFNLESSWQRADSATYMPHIYADSFVV